MLPAFLLRLLLGSLIGIDIPDELGVEPRSTMHESISYNH